MDGSDVVSKIIGLVLSAIAGVISFFLKRTIDRVDQNEKAIAAIRDGFAKRTELERSKPPAHPRWPRWKRG